MRQIPVYFINLASRPDRRAFMEGQLQRLGLSAERVDAVMPSDLSPDYIRKYCDPNIRFRLHPLESACSLSHEKVWGLIAKSEAPAAVVLEDDAKLSPLLAWLVVSPRMTELMAGFDLVRLETNGRRLRMLPPSLTIERVAIRRFLSPERGSCGYIISQEGAKAMLAREVHRFHPVDHALFDHSFAPIPEERRALCDPGLCMQLANAGEETATVGKSDINTGAGEAYPHNYVKDHRWRLRVERARADLVKTATHLRHAPKGITRRSVDFAAD